MVPISFACRPQFYTLVWFPRVREINLRLLKCLFVKHRSNIRLVLESLSLPSAFVAQSADGRRPWKFMKNLERAFSSSLHSVQLMSHWTVSDGKAAFERTGEYRSLPTYFTRVVGNCARNERERERERDGRSGKREKERTRNFFDNSCAAH